MPTDCEPCPGKTNARAVKSIKVTSRVEVGRDIRYIADAVKSRVYVQRERARRAARTAGAIELAALREVARRGYPRLTVTDIARRARVAPRTVYLHAASKEQLVEQ